MADGSSGLSLSEMGISTVKKTAQAVKKQATPFIQGAKQQLTGQTPKPQVPSAYGQSNSQPPDEGGIFDIFNPKKQTTNSGNNNQSSPQQQQVQQNPQGAIPPKAAPPPSEQISQQMSGSFDLSGLQNQDYQTLFEKGSSSNTQQPQSSADPKNMPFTSDIKKTAEERELEKQQLMESLRKKLHDAYFEEFEEKSEGKKGEEETVQEKLEREDQEEKQKQMVEQEEEQKKAPILPAGVQGRQGAHEGLKNKG